MKGDKNIKRLEEQLTKAKEKEERTKAKEETKIRKDAVRKGNRGIRTGSEPVNNEVSDETVEKLIKLKGADKIRIKQELIIDRLKEYQKPIKIGKTEQAPTDKDVLAYKRILNGCNIKQLEIMGHLWKYPLKLDIGDRLKSRNKKEFAVVTIFNDNQTSDTGVIHCYDRTFSRNEMTYMVMSERGVYDPEFKMMHFYYYANQPCAIVFQKGKLPVNTYDARLIDDTIQMKVIEALAAVDIEKFIKITLVCIVLVLIMTAIILLILANQHGLIPTGA